MPKKKHRINTALFKKIMDEGRFFRTQSANIVYVKSGDFYKFSVVAPKKLFKKAYLRNRAKRVVREIIKDKLENKNINNVHFIVFIKQKATKDNFDDLKNAFARDFNNFLTKL